VKNANGGDLCSKV